MITDSSGAATSGTIECETCVIGSGPAGIVAALELAAKGHEVLLLESGRIDCDPRIQQLAVAGIADPLRHAPLAIAVQRRLGGTSGIWGGRCVPLDPVDFAQRDYVAGPGWPITQQELSRWYPKACEYLRAGVAEFSLRNALPDSTQPIVPGFRDGDVLSSTLERWCLPTDLGTEFRPALRDSRRIQVHLGLTCTELVTGAAANHISHARARNLQGGSLAIHARQFILATGGIEAVRLLLNARQRDVEGLGNRGGHLGRFYMGHISGKIADIQFDTDPRYTVSGFERDGEGVYCRRRFTVSRERQLRDGLLNCAFWLDNPHPADAAHRNGILSAAYLALSAPVLAPALAPAAIRASIIEHPARSTHLRHVANVLADLPATLGFLPGFLVRRYMKRRRLPGFFLHNRANRYALHYHGEQAPNPHSRIWLGEQRDALGVRVPQVDLRYSTQDYSSVRRSHEVLDQHLRMLKVGRLGYRVEDIEGAIAGQARDGFHQIGGTRMALRPEDGVVDADCRVHELDNLYVASSAVFPTSGQANPTLSIVALAARIADRVDRQLHTPQVHAS